MYKKIVKTIHLLMGIDYFINGINWWFKLITPYPSLSDFTLNPPPPDMVGAMIETGFMFHIVKAIEILAGLALLSNRFVPLMLVVVFPITMSVCFVDVILVASPRGYIMGLGAFALNSFLMLSYYSYYRALFSTRAQPDGLIFNKEVIIPVVEPDIWQVSNLRRKVMPVLACIALIFGLVMVSWVAIMMIQYIQNPLPLGGIAN